MLAQGRFRQLGGRRRCVVEGEMRAAAFGQLELAVDHASRVDLAMVQLLDR